MKKETQEREHRCLISTHTPDTETEFTVGVFSERQGISKYIQ